MAEFFVDKSETKSGHVIHDKDCNMITPVENFKYLGSYASALAAHKKASGLYNKVDYCPTCLEQK